MTVGRRLLWSVPGFAVTIVLAAVPLVGASAGAASPGCVITESMAEPTCTVVPVVAGSSDTITPPSGAAVSAPAPGSVPARLAGASSLPFTGADIEELAVVGAGAVLVGGALVRRRRRSPA